MRKDSNLISFKSFFQFGASLDESKVLQSIRDVFEDHLKNLSCISEPDDYKKYGVFDEETGEFDFFTDKFLEPLRAQMEFQENMITTQYFLTFFEEKKKRLDLLEGPSAKFIADWSSFRWQRFKKLSRNGDDAEEKEN